MDLDDDQDDYVSNYSWLGFLTSSVLVLVLVLLMGVMVWI